MESPHPEDVGQISLRSPLYKKHQLLPPPPLGLMKSTTQRKQGYHSDKKAWGLIKRSIKEVKIEINSDCYLI